MINGYVVIDDENYVVYGDTPENAWQNYLNKYDNAPLKNVTFIKLMPGVV